MIEQITNNVDEIAQLILSIIGLASIIIKLAPQLDKDHKIKPILSFIGKYVALNRSNPNAVEIIPQSSKKKPKELDE